MSVKAVYLELVSDLPADCFIACLRRFIARRGRPSSVWSDHGTNFVGANCVLKSCMHFGFWRRLRKWSLPSALFKASSGTSSQRKCLTSVASGRQQWRTLKLTCVELLEMPNSLPKKWTLLTQIEVCLNSDPLGTLPHNDDDSIEMSWPAVMYAFMMIFTWYWKFSCTYN